MKYMKSLADILAKDDDQEELYSSENKRRYARSKKGRYTRTPGVFSFIHLMQRWEDIVGEFMAANTLPLKIRNKNLIVSTKHSIFAQELGFLSPKIIEKIKDQFPDLNTEIQGIKFVHNNFDPATPMDPSFQEKPVKRKLHPQSPEYKQREKKALELTEDLEDPEVVEAIKRFILS